MPKHLDINQKATAISMLCEGNSIRGVERMTGVHRDTIMRLAVRVGEGMGKVQNELFVNLNSKQIEVDEIWGFIGAKESTAKEKNLGSEYGDVWTWVALDAESTIQSFSFPEPFPASSPPFKGFFVFILTRNNSLKSSLSIEKINSSKNALKVMPSGLNSRIIACFLGKIAIVLNFVSRIQNPPSNNRLNHF